MVSFPNTDEATIMKAGAELGIPNNFPDDLKERMDIELLQLQSLAYCTDNDSLATGNENILLPNIMEAGLGEILLDNPTQLYPSITGRNSGIVAGNCCGDFEGNKNFWNNIFNLVNCLPSDSPIF
ncbi:hypothetical protein Vadar_029680 [Vaccinium darrowii]|uniref:Uncharacterized protein n=1 Tax=Vaccinium darrowii TaxID=229202 RepID=A0ACB7X4T0_9ERIC|nr:hypothetical protein Vadar_029680 [Vaccinium darrowii]